MDKIIYFNPRLNMLGFTFGLSIVKISESNEYMVLTKEWVEVGIL